MSEWIDAPPVDQWEWWWLGGSEHLIWFVPGHIFMAATDADLVRIIEAIDRNLENPSPMVLEESVYALQADRTLQTTQIRVPGTVRREFRQWLTDQKQSVDQGKARRVARTELPFHWEGS